MKVTFQGNPITLKGNQIKVGDDAPDFTLVDNDLNSFKLSDTKGKRVFLTVPSLDTAVCDMEIRRTYKCLCHIYGFTICPRKMVRWGWNRQSKNSVRL